jgi:hypothetical protein
MQGVSRIRKLIKTPAVRAGNLKPQLVDSVVRMMRNYDGRSMSDLKFGATARFSVARKIQLQRIVC